VKALIAATLLLASTSAFAATAKPQDFPDIRKWEKLHWLCVYSVFPDEKADDAREKTRSKMCDAADKSEKKLTARGYCTYGHGVVGRTGKKYFYPGIDSAGTNSHWTRHCYAITNHPAE
jgi:hypothetical protein